MTAPPQAKAPTKAPKKAEKPKPKFAYVGATVHVGNGTMLRRATVLTEGKKILAVGRDVEIPKGTKTIDCNGKHISPGFIVFDLSGVGAPFSVRKGENYADGIDPYARNLKRALAVGITSYLTGGGSGGSMPSSSRSSAVIKLVPESIEDVVVKQGLLYTMSVPLGPAGWKAFNEAVEKTKKYEKDKKDYDAKKAKGDKTAKAPKPPKGAEELGKLMKGEVKLRVFGRSSGGGGGGMFRSRAASMDVRSIREALRISKAIGHGVILEGCTEGWIVADEIAATGSSAVMRPRVHQKPDPKRGEPNGSSIHASSILAKAGVPVHLLPPGGFSGAGLGTGGLLGRDLNTPTVDPCFAIRGGMDENEALATITLYPAMLLGVDDRIGSIEAGKDADLLILDGEPLHYRTFVETAVVNGKVVYEKAKEPFYSQVPPRK